MSDVFIGPYNSVLLLSAIYTIGLLMLSIFSIQTAEFNTVIPLIALFIIAIGIGGIKVK